MVGSVGLEPTTKTLWASCSNQLSYDPKVKNQSEQAQLVKEIFCRATRRQELSYDPKVKNFFWTTAQKGGATYLRLGFLQD